VGHEGEAEAPRTITLRLAAGSYDSQQYSFPQEFLSTGSLENELVTLRYATGITQVVSVTEGLKCQLTIALVLT